MGRSGPGYNMDDLVFYGLLFLGIILTYKVFDAFAPDVHRIVRLLVGLVVGLGLGWVGLNIYKGGGSGGDRDQF